MLRVDELHKAAGRPCEKLLPEYRAGRRGAAPGPALGGCGIHATRPAICRAYRCAWLQGKFRDGDRPDRLGALVDFAPRGGRDELVIVEAEPGAFERSARLQELAAGFRELMPVRITDVAHADDPDRPLRVLLGGGEEHRIAGERSTLLRDGERVAERRLPWLERWLRRAMLALRRRRGRG